MEGDGGGGSQEKEKEDASHPAVLTHPLFQAIKGLDVGCDGWHRGPPRLTAGSCGATPQSPCSFSIQAPLTDDRPESSRRSGGWGWMGRRVVVPHPLLSPVFLLPSSFLSSITSSQGHLVAPLLYFLFPNGPQPSVPQQPRDKKSTETPGSLSKTHTGVNRGPAQGLDKGINPPQVVGRQMVYLYTDQALKQRLSVDLIQLMD